MYIGNVMLLILNLPLAPLFASLLRIPYAVMLPIIMGIALAGADSFDNNTFDVGIALVFGAIGYLMKRFNYPAAPLVLALVLGPLVETNFGGAGAGTGRSDGVRDAPAVSVPAGSAVLSLAWPLLGGCSPGASAR